MATDKIEILIEAKVGEALKNIGLVKKATEDTAKPSVFAQMKSNWLGFTAATAGAMMALKKAFDFTKQYADFQDAADAMSAQFGLNANDVIKKMKEASGGMLSMKESIVMVNKAFGMGLTKSVEDVGKLFKIAEARADAFGMSGEEAFNTLVESIGRGSPRGLKSLGLLEGGMKKYKDAAEGTIDKQELLNDVLLNFNDLATSKAPLSLSDKITVIGKQFDDLKLSAGKSISIILGDIGAGDFTWVDKLQTGIIGLGIIVRGVIDQFVLGWGLVFSIFTEALPSALVTAVKELEAFGGVITSLFTFDPEKMKAAVNKFVDIAKQGGMKQVDAFKDDFKGIEEAWKRTLKNINDLRAGNIVDSKAGTGKKPGGAAGATSGAGAVTDPALEAEEKAFEASAKLIADLYEKRRIGQAKELDDAQALADAKIAIELKEAEEREKIRQKAIDGSKQMASDLESVFSAIYASELEDFRESKDTEQGYREKAANASTEIEKQKYLGLAEEEKKRGKLQRDQAVKALNAQKAMAIVSTTIETVTSAQKAFNAMAGIPYVGPVLGGIAAAAAVAAGVARVAQISSQSVPRFATGGSFITNGPQMMMVGDNSGGAERVTVDPLAGGRGSSGVVNNFYGYDLNQARARAMRTEGKGAFT